MFPEKLTFMQDSPQIHSAKYNLFWSAFVLDKENWVVPPTETPSHLEVLFINMTQQNQLLSLQKRN